LPISNLARLHRDGAIDPTFQANASGEVLALALQPDGRILVGGVFRELNGLPRERIARLNADGTPDETFNANTQADGPVNVLRIQPDGGIYLAGNFQSINSVPRNGIARLNSDGTLDEAFAVTDASRWSVTSLALQPDGKVIVAGRSIGDGTYYTLLQRCLPDGSLDPEFFSTPLQELDRKAVALQPDGQILVNGRFDSHDGFGHFYSGIERLHPDGSLDPGFFADLQVSSLRTIALTARGEILIGGSFRTRPNPLAQPIARLHPDGKVDSTFVPRLPLNLENAQIVAIVQQSDGKILLGGILQTTQPLDEPRPLLFRLMGNVIGFGAPRLLAAELQAGKFAVSLLSDANVSYTLEYADDLAPANWRPITTLTGTGELLQVEDSAPGPLRRFYRVQVSSGMPRPPAP
jgi:uncharacterized delta-60 repeat protein